MRNTRTRLRFVFAVIVQHSGEVRILLMANLHTFALPIDSKIQYLNISFRIHGMLLHPFHFIPFTWECMFLGFSVIFKFNKISLFQGSRLFTAWEHLLIKNISTLTFCWTLKIFFIFLKYMSIKLTFFFCFFEVWYILEQKKFLCIVTRIQIECKLTTIQLHKRIRRIRIRAGY